MAERAAQIHHKTSIGLKTDANGAAIFPPCTILACTQIAPGSIKTGIMALPLLNSPDEVSFLHIFKIGEADFFRASSYLLYRNHTIPPHVSSLMHRFIVACLPSARPIPDVPAVSVSFRFSFFIAMQQRLPRCSPAGILLSCAALFTHPE